MKKLRSIQVLRGIAACAVVLLHAYPDADHRIGNAAYGAAGVDVFFVISGFIIAHVSQGRAALDFISDRFWRIYPLWWAAVLPWLFMVPRGGLSVLSSITLWPIYPGGYYLPALEVGWTLSFELLFYIGMTMAIATRKWVPLAVYALFLLGALSTTSPLLHFLGNPMALEFLMGVVVARLPRPAILGLLIPFGLGLFAMTKPGTGEVESALAAHFALQRVVEWGVPAALVVWGGLSLEELFARRAFDIPVALGDASYSIYLFHPLMAYGLTCAWPLRLALAIGIGCVMHLLVERRIMALRSMRGSTSRAVKVAGHYILDVPKREA